VCFWQQGGLIPWFHADSRRYQAWQKQAPCYLRCITSYKHQNRQIFCWALQFLSHSHQGFCHYRCATFQGYQKRLRIQKRSSASGCSSRFQGCPTATHIRPSHGFSSIRLPVFTHHRCSYRYSWIYWWVGSNFNANWRTWQPLRHFFCFPTIKGSWKKLFPFSILYLYLIKYNGNLPLYVNTRITGIFITSAVNYHSIWTLEKVGFLTAVIYGKLPWYFYNIGPRCQEQPDLNPQTQDRWLIVLLTALLMCITLETWIMMSDQNCLFHWDFRFFVSFKDEANLKGMVTTDKSDNWPK